MADGGIITGSIAAGACAIALFIVKKTTECWSSKKVDISGNIIDSLETIPSTTLPLAWHHDKGWSYDGQSDSTTCYKNEDNTLSIDIANPDESVYAYSDILNAPVSGQHYFYINLSKVSKNARVYICIKRFDKDWARQIGPSKIKEIGVGSYDIFEPSKIGDDEIEGEQIGVVIQSKNNKYPVKCVIQKAYYSDVKNKHYVEMTGKIFPCCIKKYMCLCSCKTTNIDVTVA